MGEVNKTMVALDCGNSSYRVVLGRYRDGKIESTVIKQIPNGMEKVGEYYYWDIRKIFDGFIETLKSIVDSGEKIDSIGICTWGVDFAMFDSNGEMIQNPLCYRNTIGERVLASLSEDEKKKMFYQTGILCDKINSVYMLAGMNEEFSDVMEKADKCLMVPDVLNYFLTGKMVNEPSELSTTQLMDVKEKKISSEICEKFKISEKLFSEIGVHGTKIGDIKKEVLRKLGIDYEIPIICVPSHDTASAVAAIPAQEKDFGFVSCGTWSLIGTELDEPIQNDEVIRSSLTNELGAFGKITLLKNNAGMFIANCLRKELCAAYGREVPWSEITQMAESAKGEVFIDLNDIRFFNPESMSREVWGSLTESEQADGEMEWGILFRAFYESLACSYAITLEDAQKISGRNFEKVYIVGGGAASSILLRLMSGYTEKPVVVCFGESTSMGNLAVQLKYFEPELELGDIRNIIAKSYRTELIQEKNENAEKIRMLYRAVLNH